MIHDSLGSEKPSSEWREVCKGYEYDICGMCERAFISREIYPILYAGTLSAVSGIVGDGVS